MSQTGVASIDPSSIACLQTLVFILYKHYLRISLHTGQMSHYICVLLYEPSFEILCKSIRLNS